MSTIRVGNGFLKKNLGDAINASKPGDLLLLDPGEYHFPAGLTIQSLNLRGTGDPGSVVIETAFEVRRQLSLTNVTVRAAAFKSAIMIASGAEATLHAVDILPDPTGQYVGVGVRGGSIELVDCRIHGPQVSRSGENAMLTAIRGIDGANLRLSGTDCTDYTVRLEHSTAILSQVALGCLSLAGASRATSRDLLEVSNNANQREIAVREESTCELAQVHAPTGSAEAYCDSSFLRFTSHTAGDHGRAAQMSVFARGRFAVDAPSETAQVIDLDRQEAEPPRPKTVAWPAGAPWEEVVAQLASGDTLLLDEGEYVIPEPTGLRCDILGKGNCGRIQLTASLEFNDGERHSLSNVTLMGLPGTHRVVATENTEVHLATVAVDHRNAGTLASLAALGGGRLVLDGCTISGWSPDDGYEVIAQGGGEVIANNSDLETVLAHDGGRAELSRSAFFFCNAESGGSIESSDEVQHYPLVPGYFSAAAGPSGRIRLARMVSSDEALRARIDGGVLAIGELEAPQPENVAFTASADADLDLLPPWVPLYDTEWQPINRASASTATVGGEAPVTAGEQEPALADPEGGAIDEEQGADASDPPPPADPMARIDALEGLETVKKQIRRFLRTVEFNRQREAQGHRGVDMTMHSLFLGSPGTGKTTVARLLGQALAEAGAIRGGVFKEVSQEDLVSPNVGETAQKTRAVLESALGGVLFIDEAYGLYQDGGGTSFGQQAVDTILKFMEDHRRDVMVIFAGYTDKMQDFLNMNPGLRSRVTNTFEFEDYTGEEIARIGLANLADEGWSVDAELYASIVERKYSRTSDHSNGRWIRNQNQELVGIVIDRYMESGGDTSTILEEDLHTFSGGDASTQEHRVDDLLTQLEGMIGLDPVKAFVSDLVLQVQADQQLARSGRHLANPTYHIVFEGNPGTGKTTVAEIVAQLFHALGILENSHVKTVERRDLVGPYVGHTEKQTSRAIDEAMGGVLFVDEAYQLTAQGSQNDFGPQAVETLMTALENHRSSFVVIFAGYTEKMEEFLGQNPGLRSRIPHRIEFPDYTPDEVATIVVRRLAANWDLDTDLVHAVAAERYAALPAQERSNGRWARTFAEQVELAHKKWIVAGSAAGAEITRIRDEVVQSFRSD